MHTSWLLFCLLLLLALCTDLAAGEAPEFVVSDFNSPDRKDGDKWSTGDAGAVQMSVEPMTETDPNNMLKVVFKSGRWPGFALQRQHLPKDPGKYEALRFTVWSKSAFSVNVRIDDNNSTDHSTRYNRTFKLEPGRNLCQIEVADIDRKLNLKKLKALILFVSSPPPGLTMYFDDIIFGKTLSEKTPFIPYEKRKDLQPKLTTVTPHFPLAKQLKGGPIKSFLLTGIRNGREVPELMQRMAITPSVMHWDRNWDTNTWGMGDFYGKRGHAFDYVLMQRYLASSLQGPEKFDVIVLPTPQGWQRFPAGAKESLRKRVMEDGEGLVLVFPFPGKENGTWPDDLKELSALIDSTSDFAETNAGYIRPAPNGRISSPVWKAVGKHPITSGIPLNAIPMKHIQLQKYKAAPGAKVILQTEAGDPVIAVKQAGKGRVVTIGWRSNGISPDWRDYSVCRKNYPFRHWEVLYSLLNRCIFWASNRTFERNGDATAIKITAEHQDPNLTAQHWLDKEGNITDWELLYTPPEQSSIATLVLQAPHHVTRGSNITVSFPAVDGAELRATLTESFAGTERTIEKLQPDALRREGDRVSATFSSARIRQVLAVIEVVASKNGKVISQGRAEVLVPPAYSKGEQRWKDYEILMWPVHGLDFFTDFENTLMKQFGSTGVMITSWQKDHQRMQWARAGLRIMAHNFAVRPLHIRPYVFADLKVAFNKGDRSVLVRKPSFADPEFLKREKQRVTRDIRMLLPYNATNYITCDEPSLTSYRKDFDFDFHPENIKWFRKRLKEQFGTIEALNASLNEKAKSFDSISPQVTADARKSKRWGLWNEWRSHNDFVMAEAYRMYRDAVLEADPNGTISISGTQCATPFDGFDWGRLSQFFDTMQGYGYSHQDRKRIAFNPKMLNATPAGYGRSGKAVDYQIWTRAVENGGGHVLFWWIAFRNPDLSFCQSAKDYMKIFAEMRKGIGKQYMQARRKYSPVAVIYSMNSLRAAYMDGGKDLMGTEGKVIKALIAAGYDPTFITEEAVASGELKKKGLKALLLPLSLSLGAGGKTGEMNTRKALEEFKAAGGKVIATHTTKYNQFLQPDEWSGAEAFDEKTLRKTIEEAGAKPWITVTNPEQKPIPKLSQTVHEVGAGAHIITILRPPAGSKDVLGADGVVHSVPDKSGGKAIEDCVIDISAFGDVHCYRMRQTGKGHSLTSENGKLAIQATAGDGYPIALLPYTVEGIEISAVRKNRSLIVKWSIQAETKSFARHVVHIEVSKDGKTQAALSRNIVTAENGAGVAEIPLSLEEAESAFTVTARDVLTGNTGKVAVK